MKKERIFFVLIVVVVLAAFLLSLILYPKLPDRMASHWNAKGEVDDYMSKFWGAFLFPFIIAGMSLLLFLIPNIDPLKKNIMKFKDYYYAFIVFFAIYLALVHLQVLLWNIGIKISINVFVPILGGILFYFAGILVEKAKRNWFIGIRTPWTLSSDVVWDKTHKIGGLLFKICGGLSILGAFFGKYSMYFILIPLLASTLYLVVYSYLEFQKENNTKE